MIAKALEVRDEGTFIPVLAVDMNPDNRLPTGGASAAAQRYLLRRVGYACDGRPNVIVTRLSGDGHATNDPYGWPGDTRTMPVAHDYIIKHRAEIHDGDVVDVQWILGETRIPKVSERVSASL